MRVAHPAICHYIFGILPEQEAHMANPAIVGVIYRKLGGAAVFDREFATDVDLARMVNVGAPLRALEFTRLTKPEIYELVIKDRTLRHRKQRNEPLNQDETDRLVRLTRIQSVAEEVFENGEKAEIWLRQPLNILEGQTPLSFASTEPGARVIEQILAKIAWGAAA
jgi:putative toxin-antitoxin system antitoxin component (TIGR02293 family)